MFALGTVHHRVVKHAAMKDAPTTPRREEFALGTEQRLLLPKNAVKKGAPMLSRMEVFALGMGQSLPTKNAATMDAPITPV